MLYLNKQHRKLWTLLFRPLKDTGVLFVALKDRTLNYKGIFWKITWAPHTKRAENYSSSAGQRIILLYRECMYIGVENNTFLAESSHLFQRPIKQTFYLTMAEYWTIITIQNWVKLELTVFFMKFLKQKIYSPKSHT